jgi:hypothetical protein
VQLYSNTKYLHVKGAQARDFLLLSSQMQTKIRRFFYFKPNREFFNFKPNRL